MNSKQEDEKKVQQPAKESWGQRFLWFFLKLILLLIIIAAGFGGASFMF